MNHQDISRFISHALRHEPWLYELEPDGDGWVLVDDLLSAMRCHKEEWKHLALKDVDDMISSSDKQRHEIDGDRVRALYGHSIKVSLRRREALPPKVLYHGTTPSNLAKIREFGLSPMHRQYVHLSIDTETALQVGRRKSANPVILKIDSLRASRSGISFYEGNDKVWLSDSIPWESISVYQMSSLTTEGQLHAGTTRPPLYPRVP